MAPYFAQQAAKNAAQAAADNAADWENEEEGRIYAEEEEVGVLSPWRKKRGAFSTPA